MSSQFERAPTPEDHARTRAKYITLAWCLWREQYEAQFYVRHPIPEEHLAIEVRLFWEGRISQLSGWTDPVGQVGKWLLEQIKGVMDWVWTNIIKPGTEALLAGLNWVVSGITSIVRGIQAGVSALAGELTKATSWIWSQLQGFFSALGEVLKQIGTWIIDAIKRYVVDPLLALLSPVFEGAKFLVQSIFTFLTGGIGAHSPIEWRGSVARWLGVITGASAMVLIPLIGAKLLDMIHPLKDPRTGEIVDRAIQFSGVAFLQAAFFTTYFEIACARPVRQELNAVFTPELPGVGDLTRMMWRGKVDEAGFKEVLALHGYSALWQEGYLELTKQLPGSGDLILFVVREVITPEKFTETMALQGFSAAWAAAYWEAHWVLPPADRTRTAFLRKQIPEAEYRKFLIWYDFKPDPRPGITLSDVDIMLKTQYEWPGRIDTRWLIEWGIITPEAGAELIKAGGMDPEWAPRVAEAYLLNQIREELGKVRTVYERGLREGFLKKVDFAERLYSLHFAPHIVNALIKWADEELTLEEKIDAVKILDKRAQAQEITLTDYAQALRDLGMIEERITRKTNHVKALLAIAEYKKAVAAAAKTSTSTP